MPITVNADLFRIAYACVSTEATRYYLHGVHIEHAPTGGLVLVSSDSFRALVIHDPKGSADVPMPYIIRLGKDALKACKAARGESRRDLVIDPTEGGPVGLERFTSTATVYAVEIDRTKNSDGKMVDVERRRPVAIEAGCIIDGTFPDWRRVLPCIDDKSSHVADSFNGDHLAAFGKIGRDLNGTRDYNGAGVMHVRSAERGSPALVRWADVDNAFGVLMPARGDFPSVWPAFLHSDADKAA